jgi:hypothetical protein
MGSTVTQRRKMKMMTDASHTCGRFWSAPCSICRTTCQPACAANPGSVARLGHGGQDANATGFRYLGVLARSLIW